jgi:DNA primase catalytic core
LARLKAEVPLRGLVEGAGVSLRGVGADLVGLCPFHDDTEPSLVITPSKNLWHCLGACQAGGSVIDWVMRVEGVSFRHAVELLRADWSPEPLAGTPPQSSTVRKLESPLTGGLSDGVLLGRVVGFYQATLRESPEALGYLAERGIGSAEVLDRFRLGYANRTLGYRLAGSNRAEGRQIRGRLQALGVLRESGHEHFNGSVVIPVFDEQGDVTEVYGRKIRNDLRKGTPLHLYLPGPHRGVWNIEAFAACDEVIVCESLIDALSFWVAGFRNVTAAYGVEGFGEDHWAALDRYRIRRVLIGFDADDAGDKAADKLAVGLLEAGVECFRIRLPEGQDVNEVACAARSPSDALGRLIRNATWMGAGTGPTLRRNAAPLPTDDAEAAVDGDHGRHDNDDGDEGVGDDDGMVSFLAATAAEAVENGEGPTDEGDSLVVSPVPAGPPEGPTPVVSADGEVRLGFGGRRWRVRGLERNTSFDVLRVNVLVGTGAGFFVDTLDLYSARARGSFITQAAREMGCEERIVKRDLGRVLLACERLVEEAIHQAQQPADPTVALDADERAAALDLLRDPHLVDRIVAAFSEAGLVGETSNGLVGYLAATSRLLDRPLAVIVQSTSAAGKSQLMDTVLGFVPEEAKVEFSAMTGQSLFYMGETDLAHKVLAVAEEEGAARAAYALKLLQSEGQLSIASTGKDGATGRLVTHEYRVSGPAAIFLTTTAVDVDEELLNRCLVLSVDEDREQTRAIHDSQRWAHTLDGMLARHRRDRVLKTHRDAQRLLEPVRVVIPHAEQLRFTDTRTRTRRDHVKYLTLISTIALLHQHQRAHKTASVAGETVTYIEATPGDIELANQLAHEILGRSLGDLPPQTRRLLEQVFDMVIEQAERQGLDAADVRFTRRDVRQHCGWSDFQTRTHLARLVDLEYVLVHRGRRGQSFVYELLWDGDTSTEPRLTGLINPTTTTGNNEHPTGGFEHPDGDVVGSSSPQRARPEHPTEAAETPVAVDDPDQAGGRGSDRVSGNGQTSHVIVEGVR